MELEQLTLLPNLFWHATETEARTNVLFGDRTRPVLGQFSLLHEDEENYYLIRDRLGLNKVFYHVDPDARKLTIGHYLSEVAERTRDYNRVFSVPAGHYLAIDRVSLKQQLVNYWDLSLVATTPHLRLDQFQKTVDELLTRLFVELDRAQPDSRFFVCLSGGLDSAVIATYASRFLKNVTAVSFSYESLSDDFRAAEQIARRLGLPFLPVIAPRRFDEAMLDEVLRYGQDWRDFNVHCAWVNAHIARHLGRLTHGEKASDNLLSRAEQKVVVLTGDLMNEFVADYTPVEFGGTVYYRQPRIPRDKLRRFLVYGLDSSDREAGIFHRHGLTLIQPYSLVAEQYLSLPGTFLSEDRFKEQLNGALLRGADIGDCLLKTKVRAQVGSSDGGTLGLFHDAGITQQKLEERWRTLFAPTAREDYLEPMIIGGRYRN